MQKALAALCCLLALACGCAGIHGTERARTIRAQMAREGQQPDSVRGVGSFRLERDGGTVSGRLAFAAQSPERFRAELLAPFGQPVASLASDGKHLYYYSRSDREFTEAAPRALVLKRALGILISPEALVSLLCGRAPIIDASRVALEEKAGEEGPILTLSDAWGAVRERLWLLPDLSAAYRAEVFSPYGNKEYEVWLTRRENAPAAILLKGPDQTSLRIVPDRLMENQEIPAETFVLQRPAEP